MLWRKGIALFLLLAVSGLSQSCLAAEINRGSFPKGFVFGTASSAFQYEGAVKEDGRGPSVWDTFSHKFGKILDGRNADVAVDHYHRYDEDVQLMKDMGMDAFRFSISWSRIFPNGSGEINQAGVDHYNKVINALLAKGIEPYVTLYHWDLPQSLEDKYNGWLDRQIVNDFATYAETCFQKFGDRVKHWITFNEPHTFARQGYDVGFHAPGRCSIILHLLCRTGNSKTEPYIVAHNVLLSHATVADIYKKKYNTKQGGSIGVSFDVIWFEPETNSTENVEAAQRAQDFQLGWFLDPLMFGDYPSSMKIRVGNRLPTFSQSEATLVKGSLDFVGINHYTTFYARKGMFLDDSTLDSETFTTPFKDGKVIGDRKVGWGWEDRDVFKGHYYNNVLMHPFFQSIFTKTDPNLNLSGFVEKGVIFAPYFSISTPPPKASSIWLFIVPSGMRSLMNYIKQKYGNPPVIITENGMDDGNYPLVPLKEVLKDQKRIRYHYDYLTNLLASIKEDGCNVKGYFVWSLLDNFEWAAGYSSRFGLYFVDYKNKLKRYPKDSVQWFKKFLNST